MKEFSIRNIVENQLCTGCGMCISASDSQMIWDSDGFLVPDLNKNFSKEAEKVCPFNTDNKTNNEDILADEFFKSTPSADIQIGKYQNIYAGYADQYRETSSSGGIATFVFEYLLKNKIVDFLFIVKETEGTYQYQLFHQVEEIKKISKTRYIPVTMADLFTQINRIEGKVAISGVACFIKAVRLKQHYHPELKDKIPFLVGIICGGLKSRFFTDYLAQKSGIHKQYFNQEYRIKDAASHASDYSFGAFDQQKNFHQMKMRTVGDMWGTGLFKSNACDFCDDVATELADISLGDAWISPYAKEGLGNSVIITRSALADTIIQQGIKNKELNCENLLLEKFKASQAGSFKHRQMGMEFRIKRFKRKSKLNIQKRTKFYQNIPMEYKIVQKQRMLVRAKSLAIWKNNPNASSFEAEMKPFKKSLSEKTKLYHRVQKLRRLLKLKTI